MRVSSVTAMPKLVSQRYNQKTYVKKTSVPDTEADNPNFKGGIKWGGAIGSTVGTLAGIGLGAIATIGTGGVAAPLLLGCLGCAAGGIGGDAIDSRIRKSYDDDDNDDYDHNHDIYP